MVGHAHTEIATMSPNHQNWPPGLTKITIFGLVVFLGNVENVNSTKSSSETPSHQNLPQTLTKITISAMEMIVVGHAHTEIATMSPNHQDLPPGLTKITILERVIDCDNVKNTIATCFLQATE